MLPTVGTRQDPPAKDRPGVAWFEKPAKLDADADSQPARPELACAEQHQVSLFNLSTARNR